jgi:cell wall-associated NlpC family hydrolase
MVTPEQAVSIARTWIGTPYVLGGRIKGAGCDCATLLAEYLIEIGTAQREQLEDLGFYSNDWFCHTTNERYLRGLMRFGTLVAETICRPGAEAQPGDIVLFKVVGSKVYNHGAIVTAWPRGIHAQHDGVHEADLASHRLTGHREMDVFNPFSEITNAGL